LATALTLAVAAAAIGGCASSTIDSMPAWAGGEPAGIPERPPIQAEYPAVNERPPARATKLITEEEQAKVERQLATARDSQAVQRPGTRKSRDGNAAAPPQSSSAQAKAAAAKAAQQKTKVSDSPLY
jgi:hypothetical protein